MSMLEWAEQELRYAGYDVNDPEDGPNRCLWYNGADSDMDMMTREQFLNITNQS